MSPNQITQHEDIPPQFVEDVCAAISRDERIRRVLPGGGVLNVDRLLPFLCVYRRSPQRKDAGTRKLVNGEAAFLNAPGDAPVRRGLRTLIRKIAETSTQHFGAFLIVEVWSAPDQEVLEQTLHTNGESRLPGPKFRIHQRAPNRPDETVNTLQFALQRVKVHAQHGDVEILPQSHVHPSGSQPLLTLAETRRINAYVIGLEVLPIYRDGEAGDTFPAVLREMHHGIGRALKKAFFTFALKRTTVRPQHFYALGRRSVAKRVWDVDRQLSEVAGQFNFLWQITPINAETSWREFQEAGCSTEPVFHYRPLQVEPLLLKRKLNLITTERLADATLSHLLRQTQDELDRLITMLSDIDTPRFLPGSLQVFGGVGPPLLQLAKTLLKRIPATNNRSQRLVEPRQFARQAAQQLQAYRRQFADFAAKAEVRDDMYSGMMASGGNLLIGRDAIIPANRVEALLAHEVGTHLVTYYNGLAQPLRLLSTGLAGYDALQEGLAVLAEYLVGGLSSSRLRVLAGRVVVTHEMLNQRTFVETYRLLTERHRFEPRTAYTVTLRVYRGGGLTKDAVYLRGLVEILDYLRRGGDLSPLFMGKLSVDHVPVIRELQLREVLRPASMTPHYLRFPGASERLERVRGGMSVLDLVE